MTNLVHIGPGENDLNSLRSRLTALDDRLVERAAEVSRVKSELATFKINYRQQVGQLHDELDELERQIAEAELAEIIGRLEERDAGPREASTRASRESAPRFTSDAARKLFRDVAKAIHPDLTSDELARDRRHTLMIEANKAYALGDEDRLRQILEAWERSPEAVQGNDPEATRLRLERRIVQIEDELAAFTSDLEALKDTPMWQLKVMVDEAAGKGKDLVGDMVKRLKRDIMAARNRLDAMQSML